MNAKNSTLLNNGTIRRVNLNSNTTLTNNGSIRTVYVVNLDERGAVVRMEYARDAYNSTIINNGTINYVTAATKMTLTNNLGAEIGGLHITYCTDSAAAYNYAMDSVIVNNGTMCAMNGRSMNLDVRCTFTNNGTIGAAGRRGKPFMPRIAVKTMVALSTLVTTRALVCMMV